MAKKGYIQKKHVTYWLHTLLSCIHDDEDFSRTLAQILAEKQNVLVSGKNIRTVNGYSLLGDGNIVISGGGGDVTPDVPPAVILVVDASLSETSENPVQNKAVTAALNGKQDKITSEDVIGTINGQPLHYGNSINIETGTNVTVDSALSDTSENPVQNKVITAALNDIDVPKMTADEYDTMVSLGKLKNRFYSVYDEEDKLKKIYLGSTVIWEAAPDSNVASVLPFEFPFVFV